MPQQWLLKKDEKGRILPEDYECVENKIVLRFKRNLGRKITVSCGGPCESGLIPYDLYSYLPIIMFQAEYAPKARIIGFGAETQ